MEAVFVQILIGLHVHILFLMLNSRTYMEDILVQQRPKSASSLMAILRENEKGKIAYISGLRLSSYILSI